MDALKMLEWYRLHKNAPINEKEEILKTLASEYTSKDVRYLIWLHIKQIYGLSDAVENVLRKIGTNEALLYLDGTREDRERIWNACSNEVSFELLALAQTNLPADKFSPTRTQWEYCALGPVEQGMSDKYATIWFSNPAGEPYSINVHRLANDYELSGALMLQSVVTKLGKAGWEMVGTGGSGEKTHTLYFKRRVD